MMYLKFPCSFAWFYCLGHYGREELPSLLLHTQWLESIAQVIDGSTGNPGTNARLRICWITFLSLTFQFGTHIWEFCCIIKSITYWHLFTIACCGVNILYLNKEQNLNLHPFFSSFLFFPSIFLFWIQFPMRLTHIHTNFYMFIK